jgi:L-threonylcarbamoyladenylate synthase
LQKSNMPFITTSANISGDQSPKNFDNINKKIINDSDYVIKCSSPTWKASSIVNLTWENIKILRK